MNSIKPFFYTLVLLGVFTACSSDTTPTKSNVLNLKTEKVLEYQYNQLEQDVLKQINEYRVSKKLKPLEVVNHISYVASEHSKLMIENKNITHQAFEERMDNIVAVLGASAVGENLAFDFETAAIVVDKWKESSGHRANMEGNFTHFGISVKKSTEENKNYCTNIFANLK